MVEVGFWCVRSCPRNSNLEAACACGSPSGLPQDHTGQAAHTAALPTGVLCHYLRSGWLESYEHGYSFCRYSACAFSTGPHKDMGCCTITDGVYTWPEGLVHYVEQHALILPLAFQQHIAARLSSDPSCADGFIRGTWESHPGGARPAPIPQGTLTWLQGHSTLRFR